MRPIRDRQDRREIPSGVKYNEPGEAKWSGSLVDKRGLHEFHQIPENEYAALLVCAPGQEPKKSMDEMGDTAAMIESMLSVLLPKERIAVECMFIGQMSLREAGEHMAREFGRKKPYSKALVAKYRNTGLEKLRNTV